MQAWSGSSVLQPVGGFALGITRANSRRVAARRAEKRRLTGRSGKGGSNFSKEAIIDSCGPRDRWRCKKRIETSATFQGYERHAGNPIGTSTFSLLLYLPSFRPDRLCCPFCPFRLTFRPHKDHPEHHSRCLAQYSIPEVYRIKETDSGSTSRTRNSSPNRSPFLPYHFSFLSTASPFPPQPQVVPIPLDSRDQGKFFSKGKTRDNSLYLANSPSRFFTNRKRFHDILSFIFFCLSLLSKDSR